MLSAVLLVNWDDVRDTSPSHHSSFNPALVAQALLKRVGLRAQVSEAHVYGDWSMDGGPAARTSFERCGFTAHPAPAYMLGADCLQLAGSHDEVVLVMRAERAGAWLQSAPRLDSSRGRAVVWHAGPLTDRSLLPEDSDPHPLDQMLHWPALTASGLFVDWAHVEERFRQLNVRLEPEQLVAGLLRRAGLFGEVTNAHLYGATEVAWRQERTVRRQFDVLDSRNGAAMREGLLELLTSPAAPDTWILVSDDPCLPEIAATLRRYRKRAVLWAVDTPELSVELKAAVDHYVPLQWVLDLRSHRVAVLIDYENVARSLSKQGYSVDPATLARGLAEQAKSSGQVVDSRAYADWDQFLEVREPDGRIVRRSAQRAFREANIDTYYILPGPNSSDVQLARDVEVLLNSPTCPDAFIIASGDGDFCGTIDGIRRRGKEAWVWSVRSATRMDLLERASRHDWIEDLLNLNAVERARHSEGTRPPIVTTFASMREVTLRDGAPREPSTNGSEDGQAVLRDGGPAPEVREARFVVSADPSGDARVGSWVRLAYFTEKVLRENRWTKIAFKRLSAALAEMEEFGPTPANSMMWLNRAKAEAILVTEQEAHRADPTIKVTTCRLNRSAPAVRAALEVPDRAMRLLFQMLQKMPWVSFKLLRSVLAREQWLGGAPFHLDEAAIDEWINFLVQDGAIAMTKEPNAENPDFPVTALRLNPEHPMSREIVRQAVDGNRLAAERAILAVDHFIIRSRKPWMAMSALRRNLESLGKDELQQVLQGLQNLGALITQSYPNPQKEHYTTGCYLNSEDNLVREAINTRNAIIKVTQYMQRYRSWVPLSKLDEELAAELWSDVPQSTRLAWFMLLKDEGILELDHEGPPNPAAWGNIQARLNVADAVVRTVVATETSVTGTQTIV
jgi:uncharacterized LabA/DUF88 family protein